MANPTDVPCPLGVWTPVAIAVQTGRLEVRDIRATYLFAYRDTADPPPTTLAHGSSFAGNTWVEIRDSAQIDVYIWTITAAGTVRLHP